MPRVFLSSRFTELYGIRTEFGLAAAREPDFVFNPLDDGAAYPGSALLRSIRSVQDCDVLVLLLGLTYGADDNGSGSVVRQEFEEARRSGKPVFAWARPREEIEGGPAREFLDEVQRDYVVGSLASAARPDDRGDAARIMANVRAFFATVANSDSGEQAPEDAETFSYVLSSEYSWLGLERMGWMQTSESLRKNSPARAEQLDLAREASDYFISGDFDTAREKYLESHRKYPLCWGPAYMAARLLEIRGKRTDLEDALVISGHAERALSDGRNDPFLSAMDDPNISVAARRWQRSREKGLKDQVCASQILRARLNRRLGNYQESCRNSSKALKLIPFSLAAQRENLMALVAKGDKDQASFRIAESFRMYPDAALQWADGLCPSAWHARIAEDIVATTGSSQPRLVIESADGAPGLDEVRSALSAIRADFASRRARLGVIAKSLHDLLDDDAGHRVACDMQVQSRAQERERQQAAAQASVVEIESRIASGWRNEMWGVLDLVDAEQTRTNLRGTREALENRASTGRSILRHAQRQHYVLTAGVLSRGTMGTLARIWKNCSALAAVIFVFSLIVSITSDGGSWRFVAGVIVFPVPLILSMVVLVTTARVRVLRRRIAHLNKGVDEIRAEIDRAHEMSDLFDHLDRGRSSLCALVHNDGSEDIAQVQERVRQFCSAANHEVCDVRHAALFLAQEKAEFDRRFRSHGRWCNPEARNVRAGLGTGGEADTLVRPHESKHLDTVHWRSSSDFKEPVWVRRRPGVGSSQTDAVEASEVSFMNGKYEKWCTELDEFLSTNEIHAQVMNKRSTDDRRVPTVEGAG